MIKTYEIGSNISILYAAKSMFLGSVRFYALMTHQPVKILVRAAPAYLTAVNKRPVIGTTLGITCSHLDPDDCTVS